MLLKIPELIVMELGTYIMQPEAISVAYLRNPFHH
jgi:hypothetical protein